MSIWTAWLESYTNKKIKKIAMICQAKNKSDAKDLFKKLFKENNPTIEEGVSINNITTRLFTDDSINFAVSNKDSDLLITSQFIKNIDT